MKIEHRVDIKEFSAVNHCTYTRARHLFSKVQQPFESALHKVVAKVFVTKDGCVSCNWGHPCVWIEEQTGDLVVCISVTSQEYARIVGISNSKAIRVLDKISPLLREEVFQIMQTMLRNLQSQVQNLKF